MSKICSSVCRASADPETLPWSLLFGSADNSKDHIHVQRGSVSHCQLKTIASILWIFASQKVWLMSCKVPLTKIVVWVFGYCTTVVSWVKRAQQNCWNLCFDSIFARCPMPPAHPAQMARMARWLILWVPCALGAMEERCPVKLSQRFEISHGSD